MLPVLIPVVIVGLTCAAAYKVSQGNKGVMTPERQVIYDTALRTLKDPDKLRELACAYRKEGLPVQAEMLEKRAALRELPQEIKEARRAAFKKAKECTDPTKVEVVASAFEHEGATGAAQSLRDYAAGLKAAETATKAA